MSLGCSATNCASSCRRSCAGAEEKSAWSSVGSCRLDGTNAQSSQTGRLLPMIQLRLGRPTDQKESTDEGLSQNHQNQPFSVSSAISLPNSAGEPGSTLAPKSAKRALIRGSARPAFTSLLSISMIDAGVSFGAQKPSHALAS